MAVHRPGAGAAARQGQELASGSPAAVGRQSARCADTHQTPHQTVGRCAVYCAGRNNMEADLALKRKALEGMEAPPGRRSGPFRVDDRLLRFLESL